MALLGHFFGQIKSFAHFEPYASTQPTMQICGGENVNHLDTAHSCKACQSEMIPLLAKAQPRVASVTSQQKILTYSVDAVLSSWCSLSTSQGAGH